MARMTRTVLCAIVMAFMALGARKPGNSACDGLVISLDPVCWNSSGVKPPTLQTATPGFDFTFPTEKNNIGYLTKEYTSPLTTQLSMTVQAKATTGSPIYNYFFSTDPGNTCNYPAHVRMFVQKYNDTSEFNRWWSVDPGSYQLSGGGSITVTVPIIPSAWSSVFGKRGDLDAETTAEFWSAMNTPIIVGMTFGGGCFYGHGVSVLNGTASFTVLGFEAH